MPTWRLAILALLAAAASIAAVVITIAYILGVISTGVWW